MMRRLESPLALCWIAFCSAVGAALAYGAAIHDSPAKRVLAVLAGIVIGTCIALVSVFLFDGLQRVPRSAPVEPAPAPESAPAPTWAHHEPAADDLRERLEARLAAGRELRDEALDARVEEWIEATRRMLQDGAPGPARYFGALEPAAWPAHLARLETILRDFL